MEDESNLFQTFIPLALSQLKAIFFLWMFLTFLLASYESFGHAKSWHKHTKMPFFLLKLPNNRLCQISKILTTLHFLRTRSWSFAKIEAAVPVSFLFSFLSFSFLVPHSFLFWTTCCYPLIEMQTVWMLCEIL